MKNPLDKLTPGELGRLFPILITEYNTDWPRLYQAEKAKIKNSVPPDSVIRMEHIGSTAVPGLSAKPTIDIMIQIPDNAEVMVAVIAELEKIGYISVSTPQNPPPHVMLVKGYTINGFKGQAYHIHLRCNGDWDEGYFRDYLINHPDTAVEYAKLKLELAIKYKNDRELYTAGKTDFIRGITEVARKENV